MKKLLFIPICAILFLAGITTFAQTTLAASNGTLLLNGQTSGTYRVGQNWTLTLTSTIPNTHLYICAIHPDGVRDCSAVEAFGALTGTGPTGSWNLNGTFKTSDLGNWTEWMCFGTNLTDCNNQAPSTTNSSSIQFTVLPALPPTPPVQPAPPPAEPVQDPASGTISTLYFTNFINQPISSLTYYSPGITFYSKVGATGTPNPIIHMRIGSCPPGASCYFFQNHSTEYAFSATDSKYGAYYSMAISVVGTIPAGTYNLVVTADTCNYPGAVDNHCIDGASSQTQATLPITVPGVPPTVSLTASPTSAPAPMSTTLIWNTSNSPTSCTASGGTWTGSKSTLGGGETVSNISSPTTYTITCTNGSGSGSASATVNPTAPQVSKPTVTLTATPNSGTAPFTTTLTWTTTNNPTSCTASGNWSGSKTATGGSQIISGLAAGSYTYSITCSNSAGSSATAGVASVTVNSPNSSPNGGTPGTGPVVTGPTTGYTNTPYTFTARAVDPEGDQIRYGFDWNMDGVADTWVPAGLSYVDSGVSQSASQSWSTTGSHTFQVLAQDAPGSNSPWTQYIITTSNQALAPTVTLSASPSTMTLPTNTTHLAWTTTNGPTSCTASGNWSGSKTATGGVQDISGLAAGTYNYSITCTNAAGNATSNASVVVVASLPTYSLNVNNTYGGTVTSSDGFINCGSTCSHTYSQGNVVTLTAVPMTAQWQFIGWTGACTGTGTCTVTLNTAKSVTALFALHPLNYQEF